LNTPNKLQYKFHAVRSGSVLIDVKAMSNGHIALTDRKGESSPMYEIMLGGWENKMSVIRYDRKQPDKVRNDFVNSCQINLSVKRNGVFNVRYAFTWEILRPVRFAWTRRIFSPIASTRGSRSRGSRASSRSDQAVQAAPSSWNGETRIPLV